MSDVLWVTLRALSFVLLLQASGVALFSVIFGRLLSVSEVRIRRLGQLSALLGLATVAARFALEAPRMAGDLSGLWDPSLQRAALFSATGAAFGLSMAGLFLLAMGLRSVGGLSRTAGVIGIMLGVAAFLASGHTSTHADRWVLAPLLAIHLLIVAFWFGALLPLSIACATEPAAVAVKLVNAFSGVATGLVPVIFLAGLGMAVILVPSWTVFRQPYGELLIAKVAGFATLMGLAALNKWRLGPAISSGGSRAVKALRRSMGAEYMVILCVLIATAIMTGFFSPD